MKGIQLFSDGGKYDGEWMMDKMHGKGSLSYLDGKM